MQQKEINYKGKRLIYRVSGEGSVMMLLHGFGEDSSIWKNQYEIFPNHKLIIPDLPGSGKSEMIEDMSIEGLADAVKHIITAPLPPKGGVSTAQPRPPQSPKGDLSAAQSQLKQDANYNSVTSQSGPAQPQPNPPLGGGGAVIGHSMGGYIALALAEKYPDLLNALGLFHSTAYADSETKKEARRKGIEFMNKNSGGAFLETAIPNLYSEKTKNEKRELIAEQLITAHNFSAAALVSYYEAMINRKDRTDILLNSKVPVLFVMGRYDSAVPVEDGLTQCHLPQMAYIHILENSGHMGMIEEVEETNKILTGFITSIQKETNT